MSKWSEKKCWQWCATCSPDSLEDCKKCWMPLPEPPGQITVFDQLTQSSEALAEFIKRMIRSDISKEFYRPGESEKCNDDECPEEKLCIIRWLQSPTNEG